MSDIFPIGHCEIAPEIATRNVTKDISNILKFIAAAYTAINANIDVKAQNRKGTEIYEVELQINVGARRGEDSLYLVDLKYVGLFEIENLTDDIKEAYLLVECPRILFPFARRIIYDLHADGSLPPLMLDPVNFAELYKNKKSKTSI